MLFHLTLIFCCQLAGEAVTRATGIPLPGPVAGMALLFVILALRGAVPDDMARVADGLLGNLSLLFVPAGVGVMAHMDLLGADWLPLGAAVIGSTVATIAVTALVMTRLRPPPDPAAPAEGDG
ncbi:MAG: CidA/LrgA family protein [Hyphomicrobiales bacterium]|nr:CidA/LrgA family protein [Hyphomicrobiales bacterium]